MSKRFGRNQRRRAREAIAGLQREVMDGRTAKLRLHQGVASLQQRLADAEEFQREVIELVGRRAIIAGEPQGLVQHRGGNRDFMVLTPKERWQDQPVPPNNDRMPTLYIRNEALRLLDVEVIRRHFSGELHARITLASGEVCYGISESMLYGSMDRERMIRLIAPEIARQLVEQIEYRRRDRRR